MRTHAFLNRIRSLSDIDADLLPELSRDQQARFLADPVEYFLLAEDSQADAIMREVERRQTEALTRFTAKPASGKTRDRKQGELLLPIEGRRALAEAKTHERKKAS